MCYWTSHFFKSCSHQPLILQNFCQNVIVTDGNNLKYTLGFKDPGKSPKGKPSPKRLIKPHRSGVNNTSEQIANEPIRTAKLCCNFEIAENGEIDDVCPDCRDEELPTRQKQQAIADLLQLEKILEENGITWDMVVDSLNMEAASTRSDSFARLPYPILRYGEIGMLPIAMHGAPLETGMAMRQYSVPREFMDHHVHGRNLTGHSQQLPPTFLDISQHHRQSSNLGYGGLGNKEPISSPSMAAFPLHPTPTPLPVAIQQLFPENPQSGDRYSGIISPPSMSPHKPSFASHIPKEHYHVKQPGKFHHQKRSQSNLYHPGRIFSEVKNTEFLGQNRRSHVSQDPSSFQAMLRIPSQPSFTQPPLQPQQKHQAPSPFTPTSSHVRHRSATVFSNGPLTPTPLSPQSQSTLATPKTPSVPRLYSSGVVISPPGQRRQVELEFARARDREAARQRERERDIEIEAAAKRKKEAEQADQAEMQLRVEREMQALEAYRSTGMYSNGTGGSDTINPEGWIEITKSMGRATDEDYDERRRLAQTAWERAIGWHR